MIENNNAYYGFKGNFFEKFVLNMGCIRFVNYREELNEINKKRKKLLEKLEKFIQKKTIQEHFK